jgi:hypothetical protein
MFSWITFDIANVCIYIKQLEKAKLNHLLARHLLFEQCGSHKNENLPTLQVTRSSPRESCFEPGVACRVLYLHYLCQSGYSRAGFNQMMTYVNQ